ncbi:hypothetical protein NNJEOMEG_02935 [Fundidesulfovibrio magnetotacticus]|uniref:Spore protein YkvP/CgeB glycosyl transferase-like domain-containing protein n=1 Tax=Fundidesulfovibrio magnetotacticus TaxID=2730080 RepID=A0A6V8LWW7_9BACT|nr:DUF3880 domain-containing protein [Fundidesulfovibrio magnetotacticus]GFK95081.1 hypothetical protein NNJEOMEG_02935 [Fundidesulfovibrio magnetotacticus]
MPSPPPRLRLTDELGQAKTLQPGHALARPAVRNDWTVLGLGPDPASLAAKLPPGARVAWLECPAFLQQTGRDWLASHVPRGWTRLEAFDPATASGVLVHEGSARLFPSFWSPVLAALALPRPDALPRRSGRTAVVPGSRDGLIARELSQALAQEGYEVLDVPEGGVAALLAQGRPDVFVSVNFRGKGAYGLEHALLARAGVPVAAWLVDNPFHALSGLKTVQWRSLHLFVTDSWFVEPLKAHGALSVHHLPLAANPDFFRAAPDAPELSDALLFVGRSAFPDKGLFFSGVSVPPELLERAREMFAAGERPDFAWWARELGVETLWPGRAARRPGLGAEECGRAWRATVLAHAARAGRLVAYGDADWKTLVDAPFELRPPVDYYGPLAGMYASARCVLGPTSPLLPHGLTQRHFDVWAAGGLLLSDATPGLSIFPRELTEPMRFASPGEIPDRIGALTRRRDELTPAWRELIAREHTYRRRVAAMLERIIP